MRSKIIAGIGINDADWPTSFKEDGKLKSCPYFNKWRKLLVDAQENGWELDDDILSLKAFRRHIVAQEHMLDGHDTVIMNTALRFGKSSIGLSDFVVFRSEHRNLFPANRKGKDLPLWVAKNKNGPVVNIVLHMPNGSTKAFIEPRRTAMIAHREGMRLKIEDLLPIMDSYMQDHPRQAIAEYIEILQEHLDDGSQFKPTN
ncbi:hypothetical protein [Vibrio phage vB_VmeM-Yong XC32]|nr:hypothetical protein [Vibrio phage vB_VmeM-Yong XC31]QAX96397.1 hypothetical protein [Vibrio phage vB_VmeM-Yong XC32]QAX96714.1 hypothetical protein [Vibrio phage vB_VmeM-Yong MS31]QAX97033.1 hypothetical protein [Vibrio phage vB_VmeM-Yong MS32]